MYSQIILVYLESPLSEFPRIGGAPPPYSPLYYDRFRLLLSRCTPSIFCQSILPPPLHYLLPLLNLPSADAPLSFLLVLLQTMCPYVSVFARARA